MFKLFGRKNEVPPAQEPESAQVQAFARQFLPEEFTILGVTGANGFDSTREDGEALWTASLGLTAWMEEDGEQVYREPALLVTLADDTLLEYLRSRVPRDFIIKAKVRQAREGDRFQLIGLPEPGFDPDLKAILEEQKKPVTLATEDLGTFTLNRSINWFEADAQWLGAEITLTFDREADAEACLSTARALLEAQADWDGRVRAFAADRLLSLAGDWAKGETEEVGEPEAVTRESFLEQMELESVQVYGDGRFEFWFNDGGLFWGRAIRVSGSLEQGPAEAQMED